MQIEIININLYIIFLSNIHTYHKSGAYSHLVTDTGKIQGWCQSGYKKKIEKFSSDQIWKHWTSTKIIIGAILNTNIHLNSWNGNYIWKFYWVNVGGESTEPIHYLKI